jgi:phage-related protein
MRVDFAMGVGELRLGGSDGVASSAPKGANEFQGQWRVTAVQLSREGRALTSFFRAFQEKIAERVASSLPEAGQMAKTACSTTRVRRTTQVRLRRFQ